ARMIVQNGTDDGIRGTNVTGFTLADSTVSGNGDAVGERGIEFVGLFGSPSISDSVVTGSAEDNLYVENTSGTVALTVAGTAGASPATCQFNNTSASVGNDGILFLGGGPANTSISVSNCSFSNSRGDHFQATNAAGATGTMDVVFQANALTGAAGNLGAGITIFPSGGTTTFDVLNNNIQGAVFSAITVNLNTSAPASAVLSGTVSGNTIGTAGTLDSGSSQGDGITVFSNGPGTTTVAITNNTIRQYSNLAGINLHQRDGSGTLNATVTGNTIGNPGSFASNGIVAAAGSVTGDAGTLCVDIGGAGALANSIAGSGANFGTDFRLRQRFNTTVRLPGYGGPATDTATVIAFVQGRNTGSETGSATVNAPAGGSGFVGGAACPQPS
ncbi:MAG: hypothetical protein ACRDJO_08165, partial [Actinomycetota bacterium]